MQAQASLLHQLASLQDNSRAGPAPQIAAQMVAGGLTAADIQQLQQNGM
jgi:cytochrome c553